MFRDAVKTASEWFARPGAPAATWREILDAMDARRAQAGLSPVPRPMGHAPAAPVVYGFVNHGRWVAYCPCGSAQLVTPSDPVFWCIDCQGGGSGAPGSTVPVVFPPTMDLIQVNMESLPTLLQQWPCVGCLEVYRLGGGIILGCQMCTSLTRQEWVPGSAAVS